MKTAKEFVVDWLDKHQGAPVEHDEDWRHFVGILAECAEGYARHVLNEQIKLQEQTMKEYSQKRKS